MENADKKSCAKCKYWSSFREFYQDDDKCEDIGFCMRGSGLELMHDNKCCDYFTNITDTKDE
jgi:hypothetical protein